MGEAIKNELINDTLLKEIQEYCNLNEEDVNKTINKALRDGFTTLKFGPTPMSAKKEIKTVEVIKTIDKVVKVSDDSKVNELLKEIEVLKEKLSKCEKRKGNNLDFYGEV